MQDTTLHPNSQTLLSAWQRMHAASNDGPAGPTARDHPDLVARLFVIQAASERDWAFRTAGAQIESSLGRQLADYNFLGFWTGHDREMLGLLLKTVVQERRPGIVRASAECLTGERVDVEVILAPLAQPAHLDGGSRVLGLYQTLGGDHRLKGRPVWRHRLTAMFPPDVRESEPRVKLVASND
ncbi:PAS domain-containing protein [Henriciella aquimarina]|uniref:PAS domain-containing protein n=1 Tax=Henriciella aquimarina TaxID=545261 RepID=UPI000A047A71|nr:PAS domain-containing protein [Henriciella aquimarina]